MFVREFQHRSGVSFELAMAVGRKLHAYATLLITLLVVGFIAPVGRTQAAEYTVSETIDVDAVPSDFRVGFCLLTQGNQQYVAYYDAAHQMVVASRQLDEKQWVKIHLPSKVGWDSHNYITMAVDRDGRLHVAGNMHCVPLNYFRTKVPGDITTLEKMSMTAMDEQHCTYPRFLLDADGHLLFMYRSGSSGNGRRFINRYDTQRQRWSRFLDTPLFDGEGLRNAYPLGPVQGPDGRFHVIWVWRDTPDCATNHDLSYARSADMKHWENAAGKPVTLPLTLEQTELIVDPVPAGGGIINSGLGLSFDSQERPLITYHKRDQDDHMQIYVTRPDDGQWRTHAITEWGKTIAFGGGGSMPFIGIAASDATWVAPQTLLVGYRHADYGSGRIVLDEETLRVVDRTVTIEPEYPSSFKTPTIKFPGIGVQLAEDSGQSGDPQVRYVLKWETLGSNRDRRRDPPLPPASVLRIFKLVKAVGAAPEQPTP